MEIKELLNWDQMISKNTKLKDKIKTTDNFLIRC